MSQINYVETEAFFAEKDVMKAPLNEMQYHNTVEIYYLIKGERDYFIGEDFYKLSEGDAVIIPKNLLHRTDGKGASRFLIYFDQEILKRFFTNEMLSCISTQETVVFHADESHKESLSASFSALLNEYNRFENKSLAASSPIIAGYLFDILFTMLNGNNTYVKRDYSDGRIRRIVKYINDNYSQIRDIDAIADHFFISKYHLCRLFKKNLGIPLMTYLNTIKVRNAAEMIASAEKLKLTDIATACGFNSSSYFCKVFKSEMGVSPTEYKKKLKNDQRSTL